MRNPSFLTEAATVDIINSPGGFLSDRLAVRLGNRWGFRVVPLLTLPAVTVLLFVTVHVTSP